MAYASELVPASYTSAHDSLWHIVSSSNNSQSSFKYVFKIQIGGADIATLKNYPDSGGYGVLDVAPIVRKSDMKSMLSKKAIWPKADLLIEN